MSNIVAIVGRPNVGKSTLFNRLIQRRDAIVDSVAGVTRDRHYGKSDWNGKEFSVIDTGGYIEGSEDVFEAEIRRQVELALEESTVVLFVLDLQAGLTEFDKIISELLRKTEKPVVYCVNKVDNSMLELDATEFYGLGIEKYHTISAVNGSGTGDLLDELVSYMDENPVDDYDDLPKMPIRFCMNWAIRRFAWCGIRQSILSGVKPFCLSASPITSPNRTTAFLKTKLPFI